MVAFPGKLFHWTQIPTCLWFLARDRNDGEFRDRRGWEATGEVAAQVGDRAVSSNDVISELAIVQQAHSHVLEAATHRERRSCIAD